MFEWEAVEGEFAVGFGKEGLGLEGNVWMDSAGKRAWDFIHCDKRGAAAGAQPLIPVL